MVTLFNAFGRLQPRKVLVAGDLLLDRYTVGQARRISPEAPVAVVHVVKEEELPGGAGNTVLNLVSLGAEVKVVGRVGDDAAGATLLRVFAAEGISTEGIVCQRSLATPVKNRIVASGQQVVRVDYETMTLLDEYLEEQLIRQLPTLLEDVDAIAISDYGKGTLTEPLLQALITAGRRRGIPIIADPKGTDFTRYRGATVLKPNLGEAYAAAACSKETPLSLVANKIFGQINVDLLLVTRSEEGISLFYSDGRNEHYPVRSLEVRDVTGAGDTVLALFTFALANGLSHGEATQLANVAASLAIEHFGCARVTMSMLGQRLLSHNRSCKVFAQECLYPLQQLLKDRPFIILTISLAHGLTHSLFDAIHALTDASQQDLLLYIRDPSPPSALVSTLAAMQSIHYLVIKGEHLYELCKQMAPQAIYRLEGDACQRLDALDSLALL